MPSLSYYILIVESGKKRWIRTFPKGINTKWNSNSLIQNSNLAHCLFFYNNDNNYNIATPLKFNVDYLKGGLFNVDYLKGGLFNVDYLKGGLFNVDYLKGGLFNVDYLKGGQN